MLSINQVLQQGRYRILSQFGREETGLTYQAFDNVLKTNVIIKETVFESKGSVNSPKYSIAKQIENLTSIKHESFMQIHGYFSEVDCQYLVTESVEGENLKNLLEKKGKPFLLFEVLNWMEQLLDALTNLHSKNPPITHRNITPTNLILTKEGKIKLLTSSIINEFSPIQSEKQTADLSLPYLSLELLWETLDPASQKVIFNSYDEKSAEILESLIDVRSDVYMLGATIYHLVTGKIPVDALERSIDLLEGKEDLLANPSRINPNVPRNVSTFLMKALEIKRENRFDSASAMRNALQPMLELMRKLERETQKALQDPKVREEALRQVELARQALRKQREEEERLRQAQVAQILAQTSNPQATILPEIETVEQIISSPPELKTETVEPAQTQIQEPIPTVSKVETNSTSVLVATAPDAVMRSQPISYSTDFEASPIQITAEDESESELFSYSQSERKKSWWLIPAVVCAVLALLVGGFFGFKFLNANNSNQPVAEQNAASNETKVETPAPTQVVPSPNAQELPISPSPNPTESSTVLPIENAVKVKKTATPIQPVEKKKSAKTPVPKKKEVTVDDIINDN